MRLLLCDNMHCITFLTYFFFTGMPFNQAVNILKRQDRVIKGVQVWYSDQVSNIHQNISLRRLVSEI